MTTITVVRDDRNQLNGLGKKDRIAWARFVKIMRELGQGELFQVRFWFPRESWRHRKHFAMLAQVFDAQEQFDDPDKLRKWLEIGAGYCDLLPGPHGRMVEVSKSIAYDKLDDAEFVEHHEAVKGFLRSDHCRRFLWPHMDAQKSQDMIEVLIKEFEKQQ